MEVFKEISIGGWPKEVLLQKLVNAGVQFNAYALTLFDHPLFSPTSPAEKAKLVKLTAADLGLCNPFSLESALQKAAVLGLKPCPLFLAAFLRLEYRNQPEGSYLTVISTRPVAEENYPTGFYLRKLEGKLWLRGYRAIGECDHPENNEFVYLA